MSVHVICNLYKGFTETRLEDVDLSKTQPWKYLSIWTKKIQAKTEEWTTQTAINCDAFWLQSFGTCNSSSANMYKKLCVAVPLNIALFYFVFEGNFLVQALGCLYSEGQLNGGFFCVTSLGAYIWRGLFSEFYGIIWNISAESLRSFKCKWLYSSHTLGWSCDKRTSSEIFGSSSLPSWLRDNYNLRDLPFNSLSPASIILARARLSVSADKQKK